MMEFNVTRGSVLKYAFMPQVVPRFRDLVSSGFARLAYFMALVYRATNILPSNHVYLKPSSIGRYSIRNVLTEAANHLTFNLKHIDQIIIFFALIAGLFLLAGQFFLLLLALFINPAAAAPPLAGIGEYFVTPNPENDIALRMLDSVFGVPDIFGSGEGTELPFHQALHGLLQLYSLGLLVVAVIILVYFIFVILAETAQTGTPFGKRYNHVWAPIRLVVGIGMLVPMTYGLNAGQWITLYAAKMGSGFATTGWILFNETMNDQNYIDPEDLVARTAIPDLTDLSATVMLAQACKHAYESSREAIFPPDSIQMYLVKSDDGGDHEVAYNSYAQAVTFANGGNIHIRFGKYSPEYSKSMGGVYPHCGDIVLQNTEGLQEDDEEGDVALTPTQEINAGYYYLIRNMWGIGDENGGGAYTAMQTAATEFIDRRLHDGVALDPDVTLQEEIITAAEAEIREAQEDAIAAAIAEYEVNDDYEDLGWGGAALWYNQIADINGRFTSAAMNKPQVKAYPFVMEYTCEKNQKENNETSPVECRNPYLSGGKKLDYESKVDENVASALSDLFKYWYLNPNNKTGNAFVDVVNAVLGTQGLFDMCENADVHPLAQLSSLGKGMIEAAIRNLGFSLGFGTAGILAGFFGPLLDSASSFLGSVASIGILIGFVLFYIVPFLPFLYFMFAVTGWVKGLFEAMVGVPLWALAHLRIDGEGLPGDGAINGYFLVFEIFVRPIMIIFGLIASILVFGAMVKVLNGIFTLVVSNLSGFDSSNAAGICGTPDIAVGAPGTIEWMRGPIDELFFTVVYAIIVYMIGMACFKLIDSIPNNILRWMGQGIQTFNDQAGEPADGLLQKVTIGGGMLTQQLQIAGNLKGAATGIGKGIPEVIEKFK